MVLNQRAGLYSPDVGGGYAVVEMDGVGAEARVKLHRIQVVGCGEGRPSR